MLTVIVFEHYKYRFRRNGV